MSAMLPAWPLLSAFFAASVVLAVTPGPAVAFIVTRSLLHGRRAGLQSVAGIAAGNLGNAAAAALGLAAILAVSASLFDVVKYAGAAYLIYLGVRVWRSPAMADAPAQAPEHIVRDAFVVALLNPKTALFFAAFLPQFLDPTLPALPQSLMLGAVFVAVAAVTDSVYALAAGASAAALRSDRVARAGRYLGGGVFVGLGVLAAVTELRPRQ